MFFLLALIKIKNHLPWLNTPLFCYFSAEARLKDKLMTLKRVATRSLDKLKRDNSKTFGDKLEGREFILRSLSSDSEYEV